MLLRNISTIKDSISVNASMEYDKLKPYIGDAEHIVKDAIGSELYGTLDSYLTAMALEPQPETPTEENVYYQTAIDKLNASISFLAFFKGFNFLNTTFSNTGMHRIESNDGTKKALFQRQEIDLKRDFETSGYNKLDAALEYLENNKTEFASWTASSAYTLSKKYFINSAKEFSAIFNINNSRLAFLKLRNSMAMTEDFDIQGCIGMAYFRELKAQILDGIPTLANRTFLEYLRKAIAYRTIYNGGLSLMVELNDYGLFQNELYVNTDNAKLEKAPKMDLANKLIEQAGKNGNAYLRTCESFLKENKEYYPTWAASTAYNSEGSIYNIEGGEKIHIF